MYTYKISDIRVVDGDTIECIVDVGFHIKLKQKFRFTGIDCPEIKGESREQGLVATEYTKKFFSEFEKGYWVETAKPDKWGRWLAKVYNKNNVCLNTQLLSEGLAVPYED